MTKSPCVYILSNKKNGTLYTGVSSNLVQRIYQHREHLIEGFSKKYKLTKLVWFEMGESMLGAIQREKQIKAGSRNKKIVLIESTNPQWLDLYEDIV